jgi:hypothetical protein
MAVRNWGSLRLVGDTTLVASQGFPVLLSRSLPVWTSAGLTAAVNSSNYQSWWTSSSATDYIAFDISGLTSAQKQKNLLLWYAESGVDTTSLYYDPANATGGGGVLESAPTTYTIDMNTAAGGGAPPGSGWSTLQSVTNGYASRRYATAAAALSGQNWVRMNMTASSGSVFAMKADLWDTSAAYRDGWNVGDSRTWFMLPHRYPHEESVACDSMGNLMQPTNGFYMPQLQLGMSGAKASDIASLIAGWLSANGTPRYIFLNIGVNDATATSWSSAWSTSYQSIITACQTAGVQKVFCESIGFFTGGASTLATYNSAITTLIASNPGICATGFDEYTYFFNNQANLQGDGVHMNDTGSAGDRTAKSAFYAPLV